jgi:DNA-binding helix-hairpin-helix protein with protein kinase domain
MTTVLRTGGGSVLNLGRKIGMGGEGTVYAVEGQPQVAAKIYKPDIRASRQAKITAIVAEQWHKTAVEVAFPVDTVWHPKDGFMGFTMRLLGNRRPIHEAYNPSTRRQYFPKASFPFLLRIALNAATAVGKVHATGCVVGDLNHSGFLVAPDATVSLIDADSFQVRSKGQLFPCRVGVPEYTAPELQGVHLGSVLRTANHDAFGLAALIFYILFLGRHPYAGRRASGVHVEMNEAIKHCQFAYVLNGPKNGVAPPLHGPTLRDLPKELADMFERAFGQVGVSRGRPTAADWIKALASAERQVKLCASNSFHHHFIVAPDCPWCRMERGLPGFAAFQFIAPPLAAGSQTNVGQYIAALQAVAELGPVPDLETIVAPASISMPSPLAKSLRRKRWRRLGATGLATAAVCGGAWVTVALNVAPLTAASATAAALSCGALLIGLRAPSDIATLRTAGTKAKRAWEDCRKDWHDGTSEDSLLRLKAMAEKSIHELKALPQIENQKLKELDSNKRDIQRLRYLERYTLEHASISGLNKSKLDRLRKSGIMTAADLAKTTRSKIAKIKGCKSIADPLMTWRDQLDRSFIFNPQQGVSPTDMLRVKSELLSRRAAVEQRLLDEIKAAENMRDLLIHERSHVRPTVQVAWQELKQAEYDERFASQWF